jgi:hypothetical protein
MLIYQEEFLVFCPMLWLADHGAEESFFFFGSKDLSQSNSFALTRFCRVFHDCAVSGSFYCDRAERLKTNQVGLQALEDD